MLLRNSFKFGFELEAFAKIADFTDIYSEEANDMDCNQLNYDYYDRDIDPDECNYLEQFYDNIHYHFKCQYGLNGFTHYDGSVKNFKQGYNGFEWSSPILTFDTKNVSKVKNMLENLYKFDIYTNETCGFHTHFSYDGINDGDVTWITLYIATHPEALKLFTEFEFCREEELFPEKVDFFNDRYASKQYLTQIKSAFEEGDYKQLKALFDDSKYRVLRIHPQGTLEWRGPRRFLETRDGVDRYIKRLYEVVDVFIKALNTKEINGLTRDEVFEQIRLVQYTQRYVTDLPELTNVDRRKGLSHIIPWFNNDDGYRRCIVTSSINKYLVDKIIKYPMLINDDKYSNEIYTILGFLDKENQLRRVISTAYEMCGYIKTNVQYAMVYINRTLLPYLSGNVWKYLSDASMLSLMSNFSFRTESKYKKDTIDFIFKEFPKHYKPETILNILTKLTQESWTPKYILTKHMSSLVNLYMKRYDLTNYEECEEYFKKYLDSFSSMDEMSIVNGFIGKILTKMEKEHDSSIVTISNNLTYSSGDCITWVQQPQYSVSNDGRYITDSDGNIYILTENDGGWRTPIITTSG